jgi:cell division protease FtsH
MDQRAPNSNSQPPPLKPGGGQWGAVIGYGIMMMLVVWMWQQAFKQVSVRTISYSEFKNAVRAGEIVECSVQDTEIAGKMKLSAAPVPAQAAATAAPAKPAAGSPAPAAAKAPEKSAATPATRNGAAKAAPVPGATSAPAATPAPTPATVDFRTERVADRDLVRDLEDANVKFTGVRPSFFSQFLWSWVVPIGLMILFWRFLSRRMSGMGQSILSIGSSKARLVAEKDVTVSFNDVAGCEEAKYELQEVVGFLKNPGRYQALGARIPKGILLVGPPGTGKTLLARAVAGEAKAPFFSISGSEFVEMFVGVGAARVRDLFEKAKAQSPCIVFIDELDSIGRQRGVHMGAVNDEREQTLNQMLAAMDGFEANVGVVVLAATNRPEVLDRALLRPGRFDRQVVVDAPDLEGRLAILKLHQRGKPVSEDADLRKIAQETPGFSGADLANLMNEAALLAARRNARAISQVDLQEAVEKVVAGPERRSRRLSEKDKRLVAFHEVGHALVAAFTGHAESVHKISIVPRGHAALGYTLQLPEADQYLRSRGELLDKVKGLLGGRAAEEVVFGEVTTGAENDLEHATALVRQMVCVFGMGESVGLVHCAQRQPMFLPNATDGVSWHSDCSEETAREVDEEVKRILDQAHDDAKEILSEHRDKLDAMAAELLARETIDAPTFRELLQAEPVAAAV